MCMVTLSFPRCSFFLSITPVLFLPFFYPFFVSLSQFSISHAFTLSSICSPFISCTQLSLSLLRHSPHSFTLVNLTFSLNTPPLPFSLCYFSLGHFLSLMVFFFLYISMAMTKLNMLDILQFEQCNVVTKSLLLYACLQNWYGLRLQNFHTTLTTHGDTSLTLSF